MKIYQRIGLAVVLSALSLQQGSPANTDVYDSLPESCSLAQTGSFVGWECGYPSSALSWDFNEVRAAQ